MILLMMGDAASYFESDYINLLSSNSYLILKFSIGQVKQLLSPLRKNLIHYSISAVPSPFRESR